MSLERIRTFVDKTCPKYSAICSKYAGFFQMIPTIWLPLVMVQAIRLHKCGVNASHTKLKEYKTKKESVPDHYSHYSHAHDVKDFFIWPNFDKLKNVGYKYT